MRNRKGPYGYFATEELSINEELCNYAEEVIGIGIIKEFLPVYINSFNDKTEIAFDYSGLTTIQNYDSKTHSKKNDLLNRRIAIRDLFLSLLRLKSLLLFPNNIYWESECIYTNESYDSIFICYKPVKKHPEQLTLAQIKESKLELLFNLPFFEEVITTDERQQIIYFISNNDSDGLKSMLNAMPMNQLPSNKNKKVNVHNTKYYIAASIITALISLILCIGGYNLFSVLLFTISGLLLVSALKEDDIDDSHTSTTKMSTQEHSRKEILFESDTTDNTNISTPLFLISQDYNSPIKQGMFNNKMVIGSDRFLSDLYLPLDNVDYVQAEITLNSHSFYIENIGKYPIYLEHRILENSIKHEIKNGQLITIGKTDFKVAIGYNNV